MKHDITMNVALRHLGRQAATLAAEYLKDINITTAQYDTLEAVSYWMEDPTQEHLGLTTIANITQLSASAAAYTTSNLVARGYLRRPTPRSYLLTREGEDMRNECRKLMAKADKTLCSYFSDLGMEVVAEAFFVQRNKSQ